jgi:hypothetical protein
MDYLDPRKRQRHAIMLYLGYALIGIGIAIATTVLVYQAYGFGIDKKGAVIQSGILFVSSQPQPANIYINGELNKAKTNTRLKLPAETYQLLLQRDGYQSWSRSVEILGGTVKRFDYPMLIPNQLSTETIANYKQAPGLATQSPDKRWLAVSKPTTFGSFDIYDLKSPKKLPVSLTLPANLLTPASATQSWEVIEWADDNNNILLKHVYDANFEYVLVNRENPVQSVNISKSLQINPAKLQLIDRKFDRFYAFDAEKKVLNRASLKSVDILPALTDVVDFRSYGTDTLLYATTTGASKGQVRIRLQVNEKDYQIRSVAADSKYLLDLTEYDREFYVVVGASSENKVYIYKDPARQIGANPFKSPVPTQVLRVSLPNFVSFSSSAQFIMIQNGQEFAVYDIELGDSYRYMARQPLDAPQVNATWMDGNRLTYVSKGMRVIFDYDYKNIREIGNSSALHRPVFAPDSRYSYGLVSNPAGETNLTQTALRTPTDL